MMEPRHFFLAANVLFTLINLYLVFRNVVEFRRLTNATEVAMRLQSELNIERERVCEKLRTGDLLNPSPNAS